MMITGFVVTLLLGFKPSSLEGFNHDAFPSPPGEHGYAVDSDEFRLTSSGHGDAEADKEKAFEDVKALLKEEFIVKKKDTKLEEVPGAKAHVESSVLSDSTTPDKKKESVQWLPGKYGDDFSSKYGDDIQKKTLRGSGPSFSDLIVPLSNDVGQMTDKASTLKEEVHAENMAETVPVPPFDNGGAKGKYSSSSSWEKTTGNETRLKDNQNLLKDDTGAGNSYDYNNENEGSSDDKGTALQLAAEKMTPSEGDPFSYDSFIGGKPPSIRSGGSSIEWEPPAFLTEHDGPRKLQGGTEDLEPFTLGSLKPESMKKAIEDARDKVFDWAAKNILDAVGVEVPEFAKNISMDTVQEIQDKLIGCFQNLDDTNFENYQNIIDSASSLDLGMAVEKVFFPGNPSCSASSAGDDSDLFAGLLPDVSSAKDAARNLANVVSDCVASIDLSQLGFNIQQGPPNRRLQSDTCSAEDPAEGGFSISVGGSVGVNLGLVVSNGVQDRAQVKVRANAGCALEFGPDGLGFACSPPLTALEVALRYSPKDCERGYYCNQSEGRKLCPIGYYCSGDREEQDGVCAAGYFCPPGSTSEFGEPIKDILDCSIGDKCLCKAGYFCPLSSTSATGQPVIDSSKAAQAILDKWLLPTPPICPNDITCCRYVNPCRCPIGRYCPAGSGPEDLPLCQAGSCLSAGCTNKQCTTNSETIRDSKLTKFIKGVKKNAKISGGANLAFNYYWDISAAPWNGANGFAIEFNLPFPFFLPSISLIFNAPPWHCLANGEYQLAGISFSVIDLPELVDYKALPVALSDRWDRLKGLVKEVDFKNKVRATTGKSEARIGISYDYTAVATGGDFDYLWCGNCESCDNCQTCSSQSGKSEECVATEVGECKERRSCNRRLLRGGGGNTNGGRDLQLDSSVTVEDFTSFITGFASTFKGELESPFCFGGDCDLPKSDRDAESVIQGSLKAGSSERCDGVELTAQIDDHLKVKQVLSVLLGEVPSLAFADPLLSIGLNGPLKLSLKVSGITSLTLSAQRPTMEVDQSLPPSFDSDSDDILETVLNFINKLQLEVYGKVERTTAGVALESGVCVSLGKGDGQSCLDPPSTNPSSSSFKGIAIADNKLLFDYFTFQVGFQKPPLPALPRSFMEISIGLNICHDACIKGMPELFLEGTLKGELGALGPTIGGGLQQVGTWWGAFGGVLDKRLHISDFLAKAQFGAKFPVPDSLELGGQICVGLRNDCEAADQESTIRAGAFLGLDTNDPSNNYVVAFLQKLTLGNSLRAVGMGDLSNALPQPLRDSGILRSKNADDLTCDKSYELPKSVEEAAVGLPQLELQCFAYIAITSRPREIPGIKGTINAGFSVSGRLLIDYGIELDLSLDAHFNPSNGDFKIDAELYVSLPKTNPVATITGTDGVSPAKFFIEKKLSSLVAKIDGKINIDVIKTVGTVTVIVSSKTLMATGELSLFGGIVKTKGEISLKPDMSYLKVEVTKFEIAEYFAFSDILFEYKELESGGFSVELSGKFTAGNYDIFTGSIFITVDNGVFSFKATANLKCIVALDVAGTLDFNKIEDSEVSTFSLGPDVECLKAAANYVRQQLYKGLDAAATGLRDLQDDLEQACESVKGEISGSAGATAVSALTCTGADLAGGVATAFEAGKEFFKDSERYSGLVTGVLASADESEYDCVMDVPLEVYFTSSSGYLDLTSSNGFSAWGTRGYNPVGSVPLLGIDECGKPDPYLISLGFNFFDDVSRDNILDTINTKFDDVFGCEKRADYFCQEDSLTGICLTDYLLTRPGFECIQAIQTYINTIQPKVTEVETKETTLDETKQDNACAIGGQIRSQLDSGDAFDITTFDITTKPTPTEDGEVLLTYQVREFKNDANGGCIVSDSKEKYCKIVVPKGRSVNQFLSSQITFMFADCISADVMADQTGVPITKPEQQLATATLQLPNQVVQTSCDAYGALKNEKTYPPHLMGEDPTCKTNGRSPQFFFDDSEPVLVTVDYPCGTQMVVRTWTALDGCDMPASDSASQTIFIEPSKPTFDVSSLANIQVTTSSNPNPSYKTFPKATAYCGGRVEVDFEDTRIETITVNNCDSWEMERKWTAWEEVPGCTVEKTKELHLSAPLMQTVQITDDTKPEFVSAVDVENKRIPFFDSFLPSDSIPTVRDSRAHVGYGDFAPQLVNRVTLSSADTAVASGASKETCATDGLASFSRTWTVEDTCRNQDQELQKVTIEHPPKTLTTTKAFESNSFLRAVGVEQLQDACVPGKQLLLGDATYTVQGVREWVTTTPSPMELLATKLEFTFRPPNTRITTAKSPLPSLTGQAEGASFCGAPFEIVYEDAAPVSSSNECGVWTLYRTWTIRPTYEDCDGVVDNSLLVESFVQAITIADVSPPQFINKPAKSFTVGYLANYGPDVTGVPLVGEIVTDLDIANLIDGTSGLPLVAYPITLTYDDVVSFPDPTTEEMCNEGAMAVIERTWSTADYCGNLDTWIQTVRIDRPQQDLMGDASAFQVVTPGAVYLEHTDIAEDLATGGSEGTYMKHVLLASGNREVSWTGFNPDKTSPKISTKEQRLHEPRGVTENSSICRDNGLDYNLVSGECPKKGTVKYSVYLGSKSVSYGPYNPLPPEQKQKEPVCDLDCKVTLLDMEKWEDIQDLFLALQSDRTNSDYEDSDECKKGRGPPQNEGPQDVFEPVNFEAAPDIIEAFSDRLANDVPALLTGPKLIMCNSMDQASCSAVKMSDSRQDGNVITKDDPNGGMGETIELVGTGMVYNFFTIDLKDWFFRLGKEYELSEKERKKLKKSDPEPEPLWDPMVVVKSPGMVFVNVKYKTELKAIDSKKSKKGKKSQNIFETYKPSVRHDFQSFIDGEDTHVTSEFYSDFPQPFGDSKDKKKGFEWQDNDLSKSMDNLWVPRRVVFEEGTLGQEYLLVNIPNPEISNPDDIPNPKEMAALSLSFIDTKHIKGSAVWTGTLVIGNKHTSISLMDTTWLGGQIILAGGKLEMIQSTVLCGRFAANVYCPPTSL